MLYPECIACGSEITPGGDRFVILKGNIEGTAFNAVSAEGYICGECVSNLKAKGVAPVDQVDELLAELDLPGDTVEKVEHLSDQYKAIVDMLKHIDHLSESPLDGTLADRVEALLKRDYDFPFEFRP